MTINAETKIASLLADYLDSRRADMSLPASTVLPIVADPTLDEFTRPCVTVMVTSADLPHPKIVRGTVEITLHTRRDPTGTSGTTLANEQAYVAGIRRALSDETEDGLYSFIQAITPPEQDWCLRGFKLAGFSQNLNTDNGDCERTTRAVCDFRSNETTV